MWSYARRIEVWELNNRTTRDAGGPDCIWAGMNSGSVTAQSRSFRDLKEICTRADIMMLDHQLPNVGALSDAQAASIRRFVERGGSLFATRDTGLYDEWGDPRPDFALADLFASHRIGAPPTLRRERAREPHTHLRLSPELRARVDGPKAGDEPAPVGERHPVLRGFDETDILPFGGTLSPVTVDAAATVPLTLVPAFPTYPPETAWMREPKSDIPGLVLSEPGRSRVAYMPADVDRRYAREHLPDHASSTTGEAPRPVAGVRSRKACHRRERHGRDRDRLPPRP